MKKLLLGIIFFGLMLRFYDLGNNPPGVSNDEASYVYNAYSVWKTGRDITGKFLPLSTQLDNSFSPVPIYLIAPFVGVLGVSPFSGRLLNALIGLMFILFMFFIVRKISRNETLALVSTCVFAIMPWHIHFSRTAYEAPLALFFLTAGIGLFLQGKSKILLFASFISFLLGFYSYHATKIFFITYFPLLLSVRWFLYKEQKIKLFVYAFLAFLIVLSFALVSIKQGVNRANILLWNDMQSVVKEVNRERLLSKFSSPFTPLFTNKATVMARKFTENYIGLYSPNFLFVYGEVGGLSGLYGVRGIGAFYLVEIIFLLWGFIYVNNYIKKPFIYLLYSGFFLAGLPSGLAIDQSYAVRSIMLIPFAGVFIGVGIFDLSKKLLASKKIITRFVLAGILLFYAWNVLDYAYQYTVRFPHYSAEAWFTSSRDLYNYIADKQKEGYKTVIANPGDLLIQFAFYGNYKPDEVRTIYNAETPKTLGNITFINGCIDTKDKVFKKEDYFEAKTLYITKSECHKEATTSALISNRSEALHILWKIF